MKIRYEDTMQTIELDEKAMEEMWICLDLKVEGLSQKEKEEMIQKEWDEQFNKPEYNNWRKHNRHIGNYVGQRFEEDGATPEAFAWVDPLMDEVADERIFLKDEIERDENASYEEVCDWIRKTLGKHENWADAFIAVHMDGVSVNDYAASIGKSPSSVSHFLERAKKKLAENYPKRQI